ncbi:hypothetical protein VFPPC_16641 [Pochonia chlamydosporia 170]|uniref:Uncharacterized protein n=1 Tax=Pochonia chlamydosporia 170 TaxID=1380566 RepID=A0A179FB71_METCM|nr:hypothetical protein VFPPC_16641 [Pochonia chlamydosporia 170]OAQ62323.1 hypothetical protein VFPPC_16641 [Pochonia chlamydosporia 170]
MVNAMLARPIRIFHIQRDEHLALIEMKLVLSSSWSSNHLSPTFCPFETCLSRPIPLPAIPSNTASIQTPNSKTCNTPRKGPSIFTLCLHLCLVN